MQQVQKPYLPSIKYIRGVSMLGVVAIHVGAQYLTNPTPNLHLVTLLEIVSRFSVPIFFFISAFGLFYKIDLNAPFSYGIFLRRRFKAVLIPYIFWSALYILHDNYFYGTGIPSREYAAEILFFGLAKYQLYFLVILIWFYILMPLWIRMLRNITREKFLMLFIGQIMFNYYSSYNVELNSFIAALPQDSLLKLCLMWRLNYWVFHYVFIFILGGFFGVHSQKFFQWIDARKGFIFVTFFTTLILFVGWFYRLINVKNYDILSAINTAHQLSPLGFLYTIAASLFLFMLFQCYRFARPIQAFIGYLGANSYMVYLIHPLAITYLSKWLAESGRLMTAPNTIIFFALTVIISLIASSTLKIFLNILKSDP